MMTRIIVWILIAVVLAIVVRWSINQLRALPSYVGPLGRTWHIAFHVICGLILLFLITPILVIR